MQSSLAPLAAQDWNQWRGPSRSGAAPAFKAPAAWPARPKQIWKVDAGIGHSSPIVGGGRVYLFSRINERETVTCYELADGKQVWRQSYDAPYQMNPAATAHGKGPKSTPLYDRNRLYTLGISGILSVWEPVSGRLLWRKDFKSDYPATSPDFGVAMSPLALDDLVVIHAGGNRNGALLALDSARGDVRWTWKGDGPAYASPIVAQISDVRQIITQTQRHVVGVSSAEGRLLWQIPFTTDYEQNIVSPIVINDLVIYSGLSQPTTGIRVRQASGKWSTEKVWENADTPMYMSSPVENGGLLFGFTHRNKGQFFCVDPRTGRTLWSTRGREAENASLVTAAGLLMATTTEGELVVARPNPEAFGIVKRYTVADSPIWAHPAPAGNGVLVKDESTLSYWTF